jgi:hypothetical protein
MAVRLIQAQAGEQGETLVTVATEVAGEALVPTVLLLALVVLAHKEAMEATRSLGEATMVGAAAAAEWVATARMPPSEVGAQAGVVAMGQTRIQEAPFSIAEGAERVPPVSITAQRAEPPERQATVAATAVPQEPIPVVVPVEVARLVLPESGEAEP